MTTVVRSRSDIPVVTASRAAVDRRPALVSEPEPASHRQRRT
ncbi:hypothetical protein [Streptomyces californicus]